MSANNFLTGSVIRYQPVDLLPHNCFFFFFSLRKKTHNCYYYYFDKKNRNYYCFDFSFLKTSLKSILMYTGRRFERVMWNQIDQ